VVVGSTVFRSDHIGWSETTGHAARRWRIHEHDADDWQAAMQALLLVTEHDGPAMFARIGVMKALNCHVERVFDPSRKDTQWGRPKLARDQ
jgi:hypothetical protein